MPEWCCQAYLVQVGLELCNNSSKLITDMRQVRCFMGEEGSRWLMWYSGRSPGDPGLDAAAAAAGSIGVPRQRSYIYCGSSCPKQKRPSALYSSLCCWAQEADKIATHITKANAIISRFQDLCSGSAPQLVQTGSGIHESSHRY